MLVYAYKNIFLKNFLCLSYFFQAYYTLNRSHMYMVYITVIVYINVYDCIISYVTFVISYIAQL